MFIYQHSFCFDGTLRDALHRVQKIANEPTQSNVNWAAYSTTVMLLAIRTLIIIVIGDDGVQVCPSIIRSTFRNEYKIQELSEAGISILFSAMLP